jgi:putative colanic acid biosynthesis acetyltransferase WcaF
VQYHLLATQAAEKERLRTMNQQGREVSPWSRGIRYRRLCWYIVRAIFFHPSPKCCNIWRLWLLRCFGCRITGTPLIMPTAIIEMPWQLTVEAQACLGDRAEVYNLGHVRLKTRCTVAQQVYLCGGTHDLATPELPLVVGDIVIGADAFVGVRAILLPGVEIGNGAVVGAGAVVTKDMPEWTVCAGNPCKPIKPRVFVRKSAEE